MQECAINNHPDFQEPMEFKYTNIDQIQPTISWINDILWNNLGRIREIDKQLGNTFPKQIVETWANDNWMQHSAEIWLQWIQLQSERCWLEAWNQRLLENISHLLWEAKNLARKKPDQYEKFKNMTLKTIEAVAKSRVIFLGGPEIKVSYSEDFAKKAIDHMVNALRPFTDFFDISEDKLIQALSDWQWLSNLYEEVKQKPFSKF